MPFFTLRFIMYFKMEYAYSDICTFAFLSLQGSLSPLGCFTFVGLLSFFLQILLYYSLPFNILLSCTPSHRLLLISLLTLFPFSSLIFTSITSLPPFVVTSLVFTSVVVLCLSSFLIYSTGNIHCITSINTLSL